MKPKTIELLKAIRDGHKHTLANRVLAPLVASGILQPTYKENSHGYKCVTLTAWGSVVLAAAEKEHK